MELFGISKSEVLRKHEVLIPISLENSFLSHFKVKTKSLQLFTLTIQYLNYNLQFRIQKS